MPNLHANTHVAQVGLQPPRAKTICQLLLLLLQLPPLPPPSA